MLNMINQLFVKYVWFKVDRTELDRGVSVFFHKKHFFTFTNDTLEIKMEIKSNERISLVIRELCQTPISFLNKKRGFKFLDTHSYKINLHKKVMKTYFFT